MAAVAPGEPAARTAQMRALSDEVRVAAIAGSGNVVGFSSFCDRARSVERSREYARTFKGKVQ